MKKFFIILFFITFTTLSAFSEQYLLICKMNVSAVAMDTNKVLNQYSIDRYFIIDTLLAGVYDANNLPLDFNEFTDTDIVFTKRDNSFNDIVDTRIHYNRKTHEISLNEIYAYASKFDQRARFVTKGVGNCTEKEINRQPVF